MARHISLFPTTSITAFIQRVYCVLVSSYKLSTPSVCIFVGIFLVQIGTMKIRVGILLEVIRVFGVSLAVASPQSPILAREPGEGKNDGMKGNIAGTLVLAASVPG
ncbi:hypothetical protein CROQUDRAFT_132266 [Cronartium quercuum f. sp. fusiforme G11]|uniref:Uncharacterized protein n=1 Tax=Cronartium quercuum f. sp. fusiforme G11 TaxID=708437 RepID=A0A9P6NQP1_9BASI|nr:hypothetical protein CROQUDRAFT_132266 [Cronartium quercuum f. sp. fusiforme G11]